MTGHAARVCLGFSAFLLCCVCAFADQPTLDDLLDLTPDKPESTPTAPQPPGEVPIDPEVARRLQGQQAADVLEQAIAEMETVSQRLGSALDTGLDTQRQQEEILAKLDRVIAAAKQQQQQSSSSSSSGGSSSSSQAQNQQSGSAENTGQSQQQAGSEQNQAAQQKGQQDGTESSPGVRPPGEARHGEGNQPLEEQRSEWGNLPPRLRDQLLEGTREKFSPVYRDLTEQYYKRLAEEGK